MNGNDAAEKAFLGFLSYGALSLCYSSNPLAIGGSALLGSALGGAYSILRPLPWALYFQNSTSACVSVTRDLYFREVSSKAPDRQAFIRVQNLDKKELFERLSGKRLDKDTIPFHIRVAIEEKRPLELPWETIEPLLRAV